MKSIEKFLGPLTLKGPFWKTRWFAIAIALVATVVGGVWILLDRSTPQYDQASYLYLALRYKDALHHGGLFNLISTVHELDASRGPLYPLAISPFLAIFGSAPTAALVLNLLLAPILYTASGEIAYNVFKSWKARLLAIFIVGFTPIIVGLFHNVLVDFMLVAFVTLSVMFLIKSKVFLRPWMCLGAAIAMALGTLTKVTFPIFVAGPVLVLMVQLVSVAWHTYQGQQLQLRKRLINLAMVAVVFLLMTLPWYIPNRSGTMDYIRSTTGGDLAVGAGPTDPLSLNNIYAFNVGFINDHLSWVLLLVAVISLLALLPTIVRRLRRGGPFPALPGLITVLLWTLIPYLIVETAHNQDPRLMAPAFVGFGILTAGVISWIPNRVVQGSLAGVLVVCLTFQVVTKIVPWQPTWLPSQIEVKVGDQYWSQPVTDPNTMGYLRLPEVDTAGPVMEYINSHAKSTKKHPAVVCILASYPNLNANTLNYLTLANHYLLELRDVRLGEGGIPALKQDLSQCDFALYVAATPDYLGDRIDYVNGAFASRYMTPELMTLFNGPTQEFPISEQSIDQVQGWNQQPYSVKVLSRQR